MTFNKYTTSGTIDPFVWTQSRNFGAASSTRPYTQFRSYARDAVEWQKCIYDLAKAEHDKIGFDLVMDIGCGSGTKSFSRFASAVTLLQVDRADLRAPNVRDAMVPFSMGSLESWDDLDALFCEIDSTKRILLICADVIEHLYDPRPLVAFIRRALLANPGNVAFLSTPDHELIDGGRPGQPPSNVEHVRQWSIFGFGAQLRSAGFSVDRYGLVPMNEHDNLGCTICAKLSCSSEHYIAFLARAELPEIAPRLLITGEHKVLGRGGGIGTYAAQSERTLPYPTIVLLYGENGLSIDGQKGAAHRQLIHVSRVTQPADGGPHVRIDEKTGQHLLDAVQTLIFFFPEIHYIEYDDYIGCPHTIAQAKQSSALPTRLVTICYSHGNHHYLEVNNSRFFFDHKAHARERVCIERSDITLIPSNYLSQIYMRAGLKPKRELRLAYPYQFQFGECSIHDYKKIRRIVFFGKRTRGKGFYVFGEAINKLADENALSDIDEIVLAGVGAEELEFAPSIAGKMRYDVYPNDKVVELMHSERADTIAVIPYLGDNFPYSVHELIDAGVQTIFARAGGVPEVLAECDPDDAVIFAPTSDALAKRLREKIEQSGLARGAETQTLRWRFAQLQSQRNKIYLNFHANFRTYAPSFPATTRSLPAYDVVITYHNEDARCLHDAIQGLLAQSIRPGKVIVINDASRPERLREAQAVVDACNDLNIEMITPDRHLGLAEARNYGKNLTAADFFIAHDADNVLRSDAAEKMLATLVGNPDVAAATSYNYCFADRENWIDHSEIIARYEPVGCDLGEFEENTFGDALAMYRRSMVDDVGGWRDSGAEPLEDFELFYRLAAEGHSISVIPVPIAMYRIRGDSMFRTYDRFSGYRRIADILTQRIGRDGLSIVRHAMEAKEMPTGNEGVMHAGDARNEVQALISAILPPKLRDETTLMEQAVRGASWQRVAWRNPTKIRYWQALRRLQRAAKKLGLRE